MWEANNSAFGRHLKFNIRNFEPNENSEIRHNFTSCDFLKLRAYKKLRNSREMTTTNLRCLNNHSSFQKNVISLYKIFFKTSIYKRNWHWQNVIRLFWSSVFQFPRPL